MKKRNSVLWAICVMVFSIFTASAQDKPSVPTMINGGVLNGKAVSLPKPAYPKNLREANVGGTIAVDVTIDLNGTVVAAAADEFDQRVEKGPDGEDHRVPADPQLRQAAEAAAWEAKFSPTLLSGTPVQVKGRIVYSFMPGEITKAISGGVLNSKAITMGTPDYPPAAKAVNAQGSVSVDVLVDEAGNVISAKAMSGHPLLRASAETAAMASKFSPTMLSGTPVKITGVLVFNFGQ